MDLTQVSESLSEPAPAKINLALHVRARRDDGYHAIESLFIFADQGDRLTAAADNDLRLSITGPFAAGLDTDNRNLVLKAAQALRHMAGGDAGAALTLDKHLPVASGIGGGSADAAAALRLLNRLWGLGLSHDRLCEIGATIGSDIPACILSQTQWVMGRGERVEPVQIAGLAGTAMLLVNPGVALATAQVFANWDRQDRGALKAVTLDDAIQHGRNDLQEPAMALCPVIADVLAALSACANVRLARMSGSGATCFALFSDQASADQAAHSLAERHPHWWTLACKVR